MATVQMVQETNQENSPRSPEARLGMRVEDLWDEQGALLSPTEKLNACFESIPVSSFPSSPSFQGVEIRSDLSLPDAVRILADNKILSAPVLNVDSPEDASWMDKYLGLVEFSGIAVWILHQSEPPSPRSRKSGAVLAVEANGMTNATGLGTLGPEDASVTSGDFFESLTSSEFYKNTKVRDIVGSFRWAPFLALQESNSFLTMLLLLSKYKMKSVPVVNIGEGKIENIITQSDVIHMLAECVGLEWFESWGKKKLSEIGLPVMSCNQIVKVYEDEPVLQAFKLMRKKKIGGVPVIERGGSKAIGNISLRDVHFLLTAPEIYLEYRSITAKNFLTAVRGYLKEQQKNAPMLNGMITCTTNNTLKDLIIKLDFTKIHRIYVVDDDMNLEGVITLRDIISRLVHEPRGYFGDFFDGVLPLPQNCSV